jgi:hypothetical protein
MDIRTRLQTVTAALASINQLEFSADDRVGMIGHFAPIVDKIAAQVSAIEMSGIVVEDAAGVLQAVSEGGGTPAIRPCTRKVNLRCP